MQKKVKLHDIMMTFTKDYFDLGGSVYFYSEVDKLPHTKENALLHHLSMDCQSWTFARLTQEEKEQYNFLVAKNLTDHWKIGYTSSFDGKYENVYTQYQLTEHMNITFSQNEDHERRYSVEYRITF